MSDVSPLSGISGLSFHSTLLSPSVFFCLALLPVLSYLLLPAGPFFQTFIQKILRHFSLRDRLFCMAPVQQLGDVSWSVECAACCHMALVFALMHLYNFFYCFCPILFYTLLKSGIDKSTNRPRYQRVLALRAFLTGVIPKGQILRKFCVRCL